MKSFIHNGTNRSPKIRLCSTLFILKWIIVAKQSHRISSGINFNTHTYIFIFCYFSLAVRRLSHQTNRLYTIFFCIIIILNTLPARIKPNTVALIIKHSLYNIMSIESQSTPHRPQYLSDCLAKELSSSSSSSYSTISI